MRGETRIQENDLHELTKPEHDSKDRKTQDDQEPTASKSRKGHRNRHPRSNTKNNRRRLEEAPTKAKEAIYTSLRQEHRKQRHRKTQGHCMRSPGN